jgi:O-antigen/teichoic acid export membrane protein
LPGKFLIGEKYWSGVGIVPIILLGYLFHGIYVNFQAGIYIKEKTKFFPYITFSGAIVNLVINILFIPKYGIWGAAFATLFSYLTMALIAFIFSNKTYPIIYEYKKITSIFVLIILSFTFLYLFENLSIIYKMGSFAVFFAFLILIWKSRILSQSK